MSFSKAKLKRFNDIDIASGSPSAPKLVGDLVATVTSGAPVVTNAVTAGVASSSSAAHTERREQIEKFFKDAVRFASSTKESREFAVPRDSKEDKKSKGGLRLFRTPSLPHRLRFRQSSDVSTSGGGASAVASTPLHSAATTPFKETAKSVGRLKGKEALQQELRKKNELLDNYISQIDVLKRHVEQLKEAEAKWRDEKNLVVAMKDARIRELIEEARSQKELNEKLSVENIKMAATCEHQDNDMKANEDRYSREVENLKIALTDATESNEQLKREIEEQRHHSEQLSDCVSKMEQEVQVAEQKLIEAGAKEQQEYELVQNLKNINVALTADVTQLKGQIEKDALAYAQENKCVQTEMESLRKERNTLKQDLASKCDFIRSVQEELLDKSCEIDAHCDTIRQLCREKSTYVAREHLMEMAEEKVRTTEMEAAQKVQKLESDMEMALEREKTFWRGELEKRQKLAEDESIKIELEKQDVMVLLENANDMLRERDDRIQKYEEQLHNGLDYYIQLTDNLQKQVVDLKHEVAKTITEKYNYQLTLSNTRSTVNILMERLKKSDSDVEQLKAEVESLQLAKSALEQSYVTLQSDTEALKTRLSETENALKALRDSSQSLQHEVSIKAHLAEQTLVSEEETFDKLKKIASSFQERIESDTSRYMELYNELKCKDESRELYMQDMKKALDEFATVLQFAQIELDSKEKTLLKVHDECEQLKLENITLKSKVDESATKKGGNSTDLEKIEDMLIDSELRNECDRITSWLLNSADKSVRHDSSNEINELLSATTPKGKVRPCATPVNTTPASKLTSVNPRSTPGTPRTPKTPRTPRTTPRKATILFGGKENAVSPQKVVLKARNT